MQKKNDRESRLKYKNVEWITVPQLTFPRRNSQISKPKSLKNEYQKSPPNGQKKLFRQSNTTFSEDEYQFIQERMNISNTSKTESKGRVLDDLSISALSRSASLNKFARLRSESQSSFNLQSFDSKTSFSRFLLGSDSTDSTDKIESCNSFISTNMQDEEDRYILEESSMDLLNKRGADENEWLSNARITDLRQTISNYVNESSKEKTKYSVKIINGGIQKSKDGKDTVCIEQTKGMAKLNKTIEENGLKDVSIQDELKESYDVHYKSRRIEDRNECAQRSEGLRKLSKKTSTSFSGSKFKDYLDEREIKLPKMDK